MKRTLRGRPPLNLELTQILEAVRQHQQVVAAARQLRCSDSYIHVKLRQAGLTLVEVLDAPDVTALLNSRSYVGTEAMGLWPTLKHE